MSKEILNKYNFLTPIKPINLDKKRRTWNWLFKCDCGNEKIINISQVRGGRTKSCGCFKQLNLKHGFGQNHNNWKSKNQISMTYINSVKYRAELKKIDFNLSEDFLWELYNKQNGLCKLSGLKLSLFCNDQTASIDRIDSSVGYVNNNVQWVHRDVNYIKYNLSETELLYICEKIKIKHDKK